MKLVNAKKIRDYVKREINPYGRPFEGTVYEFGLKLMKYLENASVDYDVGMTDDELAVFLTKFKNTFGEEYEGEKSCLDWLKELRCKFEKKKF